MTKKILSLILAAAFILSALAGCNDDGKDSGKGSGGNNTAKVEFPALPKEYATSNNITAAALQQYIYARLKLEQLTQAETPEEFETLVDETVEAFKYADEFAAKAVQYADYAAVANEDNPKAKENGKILKTAAAAKAGGNPFFLTAYAAANDKFDAKAWAEDITKKFDAGTAGQQVRNLAEQLGVDAKEAYNQLLTAQEIIKKGADADAAFFDTAMKAAMATKTACKVGLLVAGTVASGGVLASVTVPSAAITTVNAAVFAVNAADCIVDIGVTTSTIVLGENHEVTVAFNGMAEDLAPFASAAGGVGLFTLPFGSSVELATSVFDYVGNSLADYMCNDKIVGIDVSKMPDGKTEVTATAIDIPQTSDGKVDANKLTGDLADAKLPAIPTDEPDPKPIDKVIEDVKKDIPGPADVSKQIDEALAEIKALLAELGKITSGEYVFSRIEHDFSQYVNKASTWDIDVPALSAKYEMATTNPKNSSSGNLTWAAPPDKIEVGVPFKVSANIKVTGASPDAGKAYSYGEHLGIKVSIGSPGMKMDITGGNINKKEGLGAFCEGNDWGLTPSYSGELTCVLTEATEKEIIVVVSIRIPGGELDPKIKYIYERK